MFAVSTRQGQVVTQATLDNRGIKATLLHGEHGENALTPLVTSGTHEIWKGTDAEGQLFYVKDNRSMTNCVPGAPAAVNQATTKVSGWFQNQLVRGSGDLQNTNDVVGRRFADIAMRHLGGESNVIPARQVAFVDESGDLHFATASPAVLHMGTVQDADAPPVGNPKAAALGLVLTSLLMGNWDSTFHEDNNSIVKAEGGMFHTGDVVNGDLGWSMGKGNSFMGQPFGSRELLHQLPQSDVDAAVAKVRSLTDGQLHDWLDEAGRDSITGWNSQLCDDYLDVLKFNRDAMNRALDKDPDWLHRAAHDPLRGSQEGLGHMALTVGVGLPRYGAMMGSAIISHITTGDDMARMVGNA